MALFKTYAFYCLKWTSDAQNASVTQIKTLLNANSGVYVAGCVGKADSGGSGH